MRDTINSIQAVSRQYAAQLVSIADQLQLEIEKHRAEIKPVGIVMLQAERVSSTKRANIGFANVN